MLELIKHRLLEPSGLTPHGFCLLWQPWLIWTHVASDVGIGLAYFTISLALTRFARRRDDLVFRPVLWLFAAFILLCGTSHLVNLLTIWVPAYGVEAVVKVLAAIVSLITAVTVWVLLPKALRLPSPAQLQVANDALRAAELLAQASYTLTPLPLHVLDRNGVITAVSDHWVGLLGYARDDIVGRPLKWFELPGSAAGPVAGSARLVAEGCALDVPSQFVRRDGAVLDVLASHRLERGSDGEVRILGALVDLTERMRAERALRVSEERSRLALSAVGSSGIWDWDVESGLVYADSSIAEIFGIDPQRAAMGVPRAEYAAKLPEADALRVAENYRQAMLVGGDNSVVYPVAQVDGALRWYSSKSHCTLAADGATSRIIGVLVDITSQRALEDQLRQSQKMEAVGQLTGGLAHDFNNMLQGITGSLELLKARMEKGELGSAHRLITAAQGDAGRATTLTQRLLAFSRRQVLDSKPVDADALIAELADLIRRTVGPEITVDAAPTADLWATLCDHSQMENALLNLTNNARDAMPDGGRLYIETANVTIEPLRGTEWDLVPGDYVAVGVTDTGSGMPHHVLARAFDPFFTTKPIGEGTGLGLSMIYGFAQQSGGQVRIDSEVGTGTSVRIFLPRYVGRRAEPARNLGLNPSAASKRRGGTVLVVDDEPTVRMLVLEMLAEQGYVGIEAADGESGLDVLRSERPIDLLISDFGLAGGMNGRQMADAARLFRPELKVLFITGYASKAALDGSRLKPGMAVVTKPFTLDALGTRVQSMLAEPDHSIAA